MAAAQFAKRDVVGDLGGMPVTIPQHFANYVEYDGDPGWGEKRKGSVPLRSHQSKLRSFGFDVRYPDMAGLSSPEMWRDKQKPANYNMPWISVRFVSGQHYPGDGYLDRRAHATVGSAKDIARSKYENYEMLAQKEYGLTVYAPAGIEIATQKPYREHRHAKDVFIHRDASGKVDTYISCTNTSEYAFPCGHSFSLEPTAKVQVEISYHRDKLAEWQNIQESVRKLLLNFSTQATPRQAESSSKNSAIKN
jgi:hypothetical protein